MRLPLATLERFGDAMDELMSDADDRRRARMPTSIANLDRSDAFVQAAADLPISPRVRYHTIIGQRRTETTLASSDDGVVPYWSSHLDGATSEKVIHSSHSVQETPQAVLELKHILAEDIRDRAGASVASK